MSTTPGSRPSTTAIVGWIVAAALLVGLAILVALNAAPFWNSFFPPEAKSVQGQAIRNLYDVVFVIAVVLGSLTALFVLLLADSPALALFAASVSFVVYLGYVLLAGMGTFWAVVWPDGQAVRRLRMVAVVGLTLIGLGTIAEALIDWLASGQVLSEIAEKSGAWLLVRLAVLAGAGFFVITDGNATVSVGGEAKTTLGAGDYFGEIALIDEGTRSATITAATDVTAYGMTSWEFKPFVEDHPQVAWALLETLARRLRAAQAAE